MRLKEGQWVKVSLYNWTVYGYLSEAGNPNKVIQVYRVNRQGETDYSNHLREFTYNNVMPLDTTIHQEDLLEMINLALRFKDENWFIELCKRLEEEHA